MPKSITIKLTETQRRKLRQATGEDQAEVKFETPGVSSRVAPRGPRMSLRGNKRMTSKRMSLRGNKRMTSKRLSLRGNKRMTSKRLSLRGVKKI
jgi:hypothetical protein